MLTDEIIGRGVFLCTDCTSLLQPPHCSAHVEGGNVELVDEECPPRLEDIGHPRERLVETLDVVERHDRKRGIEGRRGLVEFVQRAGSDVGTPRLRVNRDHLVARLGKDAASSPSPAPTSRSRAGGAGKLARTNARRSDASILEKLRPRVAARERGFGQRRLKLSRFGRFLSGHLDNADRRRHLSLVVLYAVRHAASDK